MENLATAAGVTLGSFNLDGRTIEVIDRGVHDNLLWLNHLDGSTRRSLAAIRWDIAHTPRATIAVAEIEWVASGSQRAEELVSRAMSVYRLAQEQVEAGQRTAGDAATASTLATNPTIVLTVADLAGLPLVGFDVVPRSKAPRPHAARGVATVPNRRKGEVPCPG